jgi:hypothetical protein
MGTKPIDETKALAPIPISNAVLQQAVALKELGLPWSPRVGSFVWDPEAVITSPSPFPDRVYFVLSIKRFLDIFGSREKMQQHLVWLPTLSQAIDLAKGMGIAISNRIVSDGSGGMADSETALLNVYHLIASRLKARTRSTASERVTDSASDSGRWIRKVMQRELGSLEHLPATVQHRIRTAYEDVGRAYLGWRRIQAQKPDGWTPPEIGFDTELLSELGHFYSDYQHLIKKVAAIRELVSLLHTIDPFSEPDIYQGLIDSLMETGNLESAPAQIMAELMTPAQSHTVH